MDMQRPPTLGEQQGPQWFHGGGGMKLAAFDQGSRTVVISGGAAKLTVRPAQSVAPSESGWAVEWEITGNLSPSERWGRGYLDDFDLAAAFGLSASRGEFGDSHLAKYAPDSADPGKYIRTGEFLNIPCPDTGFNNNQNVSIRITGEIQDAIREIIER